MNCDAARRRLLAEEQPDRPSNDDARRHLTGCPACRCWGRRLAQVEQQILLLSVPPSAGKEAFLRRFRGTAGPVVRPALLPWPTPVKERGLQKLSVAVAIAAVLAVFTLAWWSWPPLPPAPTQPEPAWVVQIRQERDGIAVLPTPRERVEKLDALATTLKDRVLILTRDGDADGLARVAALYTDLVAMALPAAAGALPTGDRQAVLSGVAERLVRAESEFSRLGSANPDAPTARPLQDLALAARDGGRRIQALLKAA
jgi:hypothetical protein